MSGQLGRGSYRKARERQRVMTPEGLGWRIAWRSETSFALGQKPKERIWHLVKLDGDGRNREFLSAQIQRWE